MYAEPPKRSRPPGWPPWNLSRGVLQGQDVLCLVSKKPENKASGYAALYVEAHGKSGSLVIITKSHQ